MLRFLSARLARLSVGKKLALIYLLDLTAVIFISSILIHEKFIAIDFARKEVAGNAYIRELRPSLVALAGGPIEPARASAFQLAVTQAEQRHGAGMKSEAAAGAYAQALAARHTGSGELQVQAAALQSGRELVTRVGNQSNLILDPDLDSYYTMSVVLLRYPELLDLVHGVVQRVEDQAGSGRPWDNDARTQYFILEGRLDAVAKGIDADYREAFAASDARLRDHLEAQNRRFASRIGSFLEVTRSMLDPGGAAGTARVGEARQALLADLDTVWGAAGSELDRMLAERIDGFFMRMWLHLGTTLLMLAAILSAVYYVARQISRPLARLSAVADQVGQSGDQGQRAHWDSRDEIGRLVTAFNGMLDQLGRGRAIHEELSARTHAAAAQKDLVEALPIPLLVTAVPGHEVLHVNGPALRWLGDRVSDPWAVGLEPSVRARFFQQLADRDAVDEFEVQWRAGGEPAWAVLSARRLRYQGQDAVLTAFTPINHLKAMERRLELWAKVFEASSESIVIVDAEHRVVTVNRAFCRHTGYDHVDVTGLGPEFLLADNAGAPFFANLWPLLDNRSAWQGEITVLRRNGSRYPAWLMVSAVRDGGNRTSHYIFTSLDISDRKASEERIHYLAHHDVLTGLPNRALCNERLRLAMQQAERGGHKVAVVFIDLDRFKTINDSLGHHVGDSLLHSVGQRLLSAVRTGDTVSRLGGDEFIVVLSRVSSSDEVLGVIERRLVPAIRERHDVDGAELHVSCSIGIAMYPDDAGDIDEVLRHADAAMYQAKAMGRDNTRFFTPELNERAHRRLRVESLLRDAAQRGELSLHYQPRVGARSGNVVGVEALLRWASPELGPVAPAEFIPIAEESRLIVAIGGWVFAEACRQQAQWKAEGLGEVPVSVNLSAVQLRDEALVPALQGAMREHGSNPAKLELELTESTLMEAVEHTIAQLDRLKAIGVKLSIDDFGIGYSSLNYLNRFPIDSLKIDRSFVRDMLDDAADGAITRAIIGLGHTLGLCVVAEGVETAQVAEALRSADCDELQGYFFARPMPAPALALWLRERAPGTVAAVHRATISS